MIQIRVMTVLKDARIESQKNSPGEDERVASMIFQYRKKKDHQNEDKRSS